MPQYLSLQFDTRYAYDDGGRTIRSDFLFKATKTKTKQPETAKIAENQTNCNEPGKWVVNLSESPSKYIVRCWSNR